MQNPVTLGAQRSAPLVNGGIARLFLARDQREACGWGAVARPGGREAVRREAGGGGAGSPNAAAPLRQSLYLTLIRTSHTSSGRLGCLGRKGGEAYE